MAMGDGALRWARGHIESEGRLLFTLLFVLPPYLVLQHAALAARAPGADSLTLLWVVLILGSLLMRGRSEEERLLLLWLMNYLALLVGLAVAILLAIARAPAEEAGGTGAGPLLGLTFLSVIVLQIKYELLRAGRAPEASS